jgi:hypothetical protein
MHIEEFDPATEDGKVDACYQMYVAGLPFDDPAGPPMSERLFSAWMREGWSGERRETAVVAGRPGPHAAVRAHAVRLARLGLRLGHGCEGGGG